MNPSQKVIPTSLPLFASFSPQEELSEFDPPILIVSGLIVCRRRNQSKIIFQSVLQALQWVLVMIHHMSDPLNDQWLT